MSETRRVTVEIRNDLATGEHWTVSPDLVELYLGSKDLDTLREDSRRCVRYLLRRNEGYEGHFEIDFKFIDAAKEGRQMMEEQNEQE